MPRLKRLAFGLLRISAGVPIVSLLAVGLLVLVFGATLRGRSVGLSAVVVASVLFCTVGYWNRPWFRKIRVRFLAVLLPVGLLLVVVPAWLAPSGGTGQGQVRNCFLRGQGHFCRYSPWNVIPEVDQVKVGLSLLPLVDPYLDVEEARNLGSRVLPLYEAMERDPDFRAVGSVLGAAYRELLHVEFRAGHYFAFVPEATAGERFPCLVFLHGMGGNPKAYLWALSRISTRMKCVVIAPTFGLGMWDQAGGAELVVDVAREAVATLPVDSERVYLLGYSNGAMGVTRAASQAPGLFQGLIYLSPVTEDELFSTSEFLTAVRNRSMLFLHGARDKRIPRAFVEGTVGSLQRLGCDVRLKIYEDGDHYLLFSQPDAVLGEILACMTAS
jgi:predicted esterase